MAFDPHVGMVFLALLIDCNVCRDDELTTTIPAAMLRAFFIPLCSLQNTLPPKVFFKFFKEQILSFFDKFAGF